MPITAFSLGLYQKALCHLALWMCPLCLPQNVDFESAQLFSRNCVGGDEGCGHELSVMLFVLKQPWSGYKWLASGQGSYTLPDIPDTHTSM